MPRVDLYTKKSFSKAHVKMLGKAEVVHRFPENTYEFETAEELQKSIVDLINNPIHGIYRAQITFFEFEIENTVSEDS